MTTLFGWCMSGHHSACRTEIGLTDEIARCSCSCHSEASSR